MLLKLRLVFLFLISNDKYVSEIPKHSIFNISVNKWFAYSLITYFVYVLPRVSTILTCSTLIWWFNFRLKQIFVAPAPLKNTGQKCHEHNWSFMCIRDLHLTLVKEARWLFLSHFQINDVINFRDSIFDQLTATTTLANFHTDRWENNFFSFLPFENEQKIYFLDY